MIGLQGVSRACRSLYTVLPGAERWKANCGYDEAYDRHSQELPERNGMAAIRWPAYVLCKTWMGTLVVDVAPCLDIFFVGISLYPGVH
jgi:hypothetical protein